jgi:putative endonuclease
MFYIYILYSKSADKYYIGHTPDVFKRLVEHNSPEVKSKFTAKYLPWILLLSFDVSDNRGEAIKVERFIKNQKSRDFIQKLIFEKDNKEYFLSLVSYILLKNR